MFFLSGTFNWLRRLTTSQDRDGNQFNQEPYPKSDLDEFFKEISGHILDPQTGIESTIKKSSRLIKSALEMEAEGAESDTPLAKFMREEILHGCQMAIMNSPNFNSYEKCRILTALVIIGMREYEIQYN